MPVFIKGSFEAWPRGEKKYKYRPLKVIVGHPLSKDDLKKMTGIEGQDVYERIAEALRREVIKLKK